MPRLVALGLLLLLVAAGSPFAMDGGAMTCPSCPSGHAPSPFALCLAVLGALVGFALSMSGIARLAAATHAPVNVSTRLLRPPRAL
jgi:hypothetical protein